jgi:hypothetical protein
MNPWPLWNLISGRLIFHPDSQPLTALHLTVIILNGSFYGYIHTSAARGRRGSSY